MSCNGRKITTTNIIENQMIKYKSKYNFMLIVLGKDSAY